MENTWSVSGASFQGGRNEWAFNLKLLRIMVSEYIRLTETWFVWFSFSDDMLIKLWDWDKKWSCSQVFEGHTHYVMQIVINPKDNNQFASASLDRTIKVQKLYLGFFF